MNDLFRAIFGIPRDHEYGERMDDRIPKGYDGHLRGNIGGDDDDDDDDEDGGDGMRRGFGGGFFGFPLFNDPGDIHKHFNRLVDEMNKAFGAFGFNDGTSITWDNGGNESTFFRDDGQPRQESLRDAYLKKPDCSCDKISQKDDFNFGSSSVKPREYEAGTSVQSSYPRGYSQSRIHIYVQTVMKPDGSVEIIRKVTDREGNEKTTITHSNVNDPPLPPPQDTPGESKEDTSGLSIFKKFFSF